MITRAAWLALALVLAAPTAHAQQSQPAAGVTPANGTACGQEAKAEPAPATAPAPASRDGTAPGNAGSTGWSGGTGGSTIGTTQNGALPSSQSYQPAVAKGLDPIKGMQAAAVRC